MPLLAADVQFGPGEGTSGPYVQGRHLQNASLAYPDRDFRDSTGRDGDLALYGGPQARPLLGSRHTDPMEPLRNTCEDKRPRGIGGVVWAT